MGLNLKMRVEATAAQFEKLKGKDSLIAFLQSSAGVGAIEDLPPEERGRVVRAMDKEIRNVESLPMLARIGVKAFAKMGKRR